jgi:nicotinate-nucleotide adenylyltransferase
MKTGIFGGTFDPVHNGHVELCRQAEREAGLDRIFVVPARLQPFKLDQKVADGDHRMEMLRLAFREDDRIQISDFECSRVEISYTIHTLREFRRRFPEDEIYFILGTDAFMKIQLWREYKEILTNYHLLVGVRPGYREEELKHLICHLQQEFKADIRLLTNKELKISSTELKEKIRQGCPLETWLPDIVERYIKEHALYT